MEPRFDRRAIPLILGACCAWIGPVEATELRVPVAVSETRANLEGGRLTVLLDQRPQRLSGILGPPAAGPRQGEHEWRVLVYFDAPLTSATGLRQAVAFLSREAEALTRLGPTEVVLADPRPRRLVEPTRDPVAVRNAIRDIRTEARTTAELIWHRQRHSSAGDGIDNSQAAEALRYEFELLARQRTGLLAQLAGSSPGHQGLLILIRSGFDLNPRAFYTGQTAGSFLEDPRVSVSQSAVSRAIAAAGWTAMGLALGPRPEEFADPTAPLLDLARATGGEVLNRRSDAARFLARITTWPILVVDAEAGSGILPIEVLAGDPVRKLPTRAWAATALPSLLVETLLAQVDSVTEAPPVLQILRPEGLTLAGEVRFRTITGHRRIHQVEFRLDDVEVARTRKSPFSALIDLGAEVRPHSVQAIAYSRSGRKLGEDSLQLNIGLEPPRVAIESLSYDAEKGELLLAVTASEPSGCRPDRVEIYLNEQSRAVLVEAPYRARIPTAAPEPTDIIRVVARYPDGEMAEAAALPGATGPGEELEVNLVELLAMVTPRDRSTEVELEKGDFIIRQEGRPLAIDHFSQWRDLQLTLGLVLDTSDSMDPILEDARQAGERFFRQALRPGDEAFVVDFDSRPRLTRRITADSDRLLHSLEGLEARGMTALYDAIVFSLQQFEDSAGRRALVVVTDGEDSASYYQPRECVRQARLLGVPVYLIVLGGPPDPHRDPELLRNLMVARRSGGEVYYISDLDDLGDIYDQIVGELRRQYFLAFNAGHTLSPEELEEIEIEVVGKGVTVRTLLASQQSGG